MGTFLPRPPARARGIRGWGRGRRRPPLGPGHGHFRHVPVPGTGTCLGGTRPGREAVGRARAARAPLLAPSAPALPRTERRSRSARHAAGWGMGGDHGRHRRGTGRGARACGAARAAALRAGRRRPDALPRRCCLCLELPRDTAAGRSAARRSGRRARAVDARDDRARLRADRTDRPRRLGDGRGAQAGDPRKAAGARAPLRHARRSDGAARMKVVGTIAELETVPGTGLVPTMGALHDGHVALLRAARKENRAVVMSLFVNPAQFDEQADLDAYPRDEARDLEIAEAEGVDVVFAPAAGELYPLGFATWVDPDETGAEGAARPGHFRGVATVCLKLFNLVRPQRAYFGQKDAQQIAVIRRLVRDLNLPVEIRAVPTVRDPDGLALSSRNGRLSAEERKRALGLPRALASAAGEPDPVAAARGSLNGLEPEYVELLDLGDARVLAAAIRVGSTRLIDNVLVEGEFE